MRKDTYSRTYSEAQDLTRLPEAGTDLFGALAHDNTAPLVILQRAVGVPHHLKHVVDRVIHIPGKRREERRQRYVNTETTRRGLWLPRRQRISATVANYN